MGEKERLEKLAEKYLELMSIVAQYDILGIYQKRIAELEAELKSEMEELAQLEELRKKALIFLGEYKEVRPLRPIYVVRNLMATLRSMKVGKTYSIRDFYKAVGVSKTVMVLLKKLEKEGYIKIGKDSITLLKEVPEGWEL